MDAVVAAKHRRVSFAGRPGGCVDDALQRLGRKRQVMITVNQFHSAGCVVRQSDLLTVLPRSFVPATGFADELTCRTLPFEMPGIDVALLWHRRHDRDAAQRWLLDTLRQAAVAVARLAPAPHAGPLARPSAPSRRPPAATCRADSVAPRRDRGADATAAPRRCRASRTAACGR